MEFFALLGLIALIVIVVRLRRRRGRKRFLEAVHIYDQERSRRIAAGDDLWAKPTAESLAERNQLHLLDEIDRQRSDAEKISAHTSETEEPASHDDDIDDDDGYERFVSAMWQQVGVDLNGIVIERTSLSGPVECTLHSLVNGLNGYGYLNLYEGGQRKTYAADGRHRWRRFGQAIESSAFTAIQHGEDPDAALRFQRYACSFDEARLPNFDRLQTTDKRYVLAYRSDEKGLSYRVVSKVIRLGDRFSARCHFRWGERRTFLSRNLREVLDLQTEQRVDVETFLAKRK